MIARLARHIQRNRIEIVQTHLFKPAVVGVLAARMTGRPVIVTRHHTDEMDIVGTRAHVLADRVTARGASCVVGFAEAVRRRLIEREAVSEDKVRVIPQGFRFDELEPLADDVAGLRAELGLDGRFVIGDVARFFPTKRQQDLLRAGARLSESIDELAVLLVGGGDSGQLTALAAEEGMADRTVVLGHREDVAACFGVMDVVVHPSLTEAFSQVLVEAMAARRPVVATNVASAAEIIDDGVTGMLVPARDPRAIATAVQQLYDDSALRTRLGQAARRSVRERFPVENMVKSQLELYSEILT
jgi:glycosyltransferase involved in cell wall biosynthesis